MPSNDRRLTLDRICAEAVRRHGANWRLVDQEIQRLLAALPAAERESLERDAKRALLGGISPNRAARSN